MPTVSEIAWLAGLLEGEGSFNDAAHTPSFVRPRISLHMTDRDVVERAAQLLQSSVYIRRPNGTTHYKPVYICATTRANTAIAWMLTLYSFLGVRRRAKIREIVAKWQQIGHPQKGWAGRWQKKRLCYNKRHLLPAGFKGLCPDCRAALRAVDRDRQREKRRRAGIPERKRRVPKLHPAEALEIRICNP